MSYLKAITKDILIYEGEYTAGWEMEQDYSGRRYSKPRKEWGLLLKITDHQKGYWAEAPMSEKEAKDLVTAIEEYLKEAPSRW